MALFHLEHPNTYFRMLFVDFSSAFNTLISHKLVHKLISLGLSTSLCSWIMDFLTNRLQNVRIGNLTSSTIILNTSQGCGLSPALFTQDCVPIHSFNTIAKFADDNILVGLICDNSERRSNIWLSGIWTTTWS